MERRIDRLGRIVIPSEMRKKIKLKARDEVFIGVVGEVIYLSKEPVTDFISRRLDDLCRLCIPMEIRSKLSIANNAKLDCVFEHYAQLLVDQCWLEVVVFEIPRMNLQRQDQEDLAFIISSKVPVEVQFLRTTRRDIQVTVKRIKGEC